MLYLALFSEDLVVHDKKCVVRFVGETIRTY